MKMRNYMKKKQDSEILQRIMPEIMKVLVYASEHRKVIARAFTVLLLIPILAVFVIHRNIREAQLDSIGKISMADFPIAASSQNKGVITIPTGIVKANPFVPYREALENKVVDDVPAFNLVEPPEVINENSDAARLMDTIVSGILYDKFSPSAILNIEGTDYLVKKGDVVNNYKVINIAQDAVTVQLGSNVYKAGIGEILTEGNLNYNNVSNLNKKFGGER